MIEPSDNLEQESAMVKVAPYPDVVCFPCGQQYGRGRRAGALATAYEGTCGICGRQTVVTEPRDFGHLRQWPVTP